MAGPLSSEASFDWLEPIRKMSNQELEKLAAPPTSQSLPWLFGGGGSLLQRIFGNLFSRPATASRGKWLLGGFIVWIIKTVLVSAGLTAAREWITGKLPKSTTPDQKDNKESKTSPTETSSYFKKLEPSSKTDEKEMWVVPLVGDGTVEDTLIIWALDLYPNLKHYENIENIIKNAPSFRTVVSLLKKDPRKIGPKSMVMPEEFHDRKSVIDIFIDDVIRSLK